MENGRINLFFVHVNKTENQWGVLSSRKTLIRSIFLDVAGVADTSLQ